MNANHPRNSELERELTAMLARRATDIRLSPPPPAVLDEPHAQPRRHLGTLAVAAAAAAVLLLVGGTIVGIRASKDSQAAPAATQHDVTTSPSPSTGTTAPAPAKSCVAAMPKSWLNAIGAHQLTFDVADNNPTGITPDGSALVWQSAERTDGSNGFSHSELAIFTPGGKGRTIWSEDSGTDIPQTDPTSAATDRWLVFGMGRTQNSGIMHAVWTWDRQKGTSGGATMVWQLTKDQEGLTQSLGIPSTPIVIGNAAYWIVQKYNEDAHQTLYRLDLNSNAPPSTYPVVDKYVTKLLSIGGKLALLSQPSAGPGQVLGANTILGSDGAKIPPAVAMAAGAALLVTSDGDLVQWITQSGKQRSLYTWQASMDSPQSVRMPDGRQPEVLNYPFVLGRAGDGSTQVDPPTYQLFDAQTGVTVTLPAGMSMAGVGGGQVMVTQAGSKLGVGALSLVPLTALPDAHC